MKKKVYLSLLAALAAGSVLLFSGCGVDLTTINEEEETLSAEMESEALSDGTINIHSVWYQSGGDLLTSATITFSDESGELYSAATDDTGKLDTCNLPGNTVISCDVTDSAGETIASAEMIFKISDDYSSLTIYTTSEEDNQCILEIPTDETDFRAAIFLTEDDQISFANLTPWSDSYDEEETDTADESTDADASDEGEDTAAGGTSESGDEASSDGTSESGDDASAGDTSDGAEASSGDTTEE